MIFSLDEETKETIQGTAKVVEQFKRESLKFVLQANGYGPPEENIHPEIRRRAHAARPLLSKHDTIGSLAEELAPTFDEKMGTTRRWLCDKNPLYEPDPPETREEKHARLRIIVLRIAAFTERP